MSRSLSAALAAVLLFSPAAVQADWWSGSWNTYHRNKDWPHPFVCPDRVDAVAMFQLMTVNGWRRQNLMGAHHFSPNSRELSQAGRQKVKWILTQAPLAHRTIYIERGDTADITANRIDAVQQLAGFILPAGRLPDVQETHIVTEGHPAADIDQTHTLFRESRPAPVLPTSGPGDSE